MKPGLERVSTLAEEELVLLQQRRWGPGLSARNGKRADGRPDQIHFLGGNGMEVAEAGCVGVTHDAGQAVIRQPEDGELRPRLLVARRTGEELAVMQSLGE